MIAAPAVYGRGHARWAEANLTKPEGSRHIAGDILSNAVYAHTVARLARDGARSLYEGSIAEAIVAATREGPRPGAPILADMAAHTPSERGTLCRPFQVYVICVPPPSSGMAVLQLLKMDGGGR